MANPMPTTADTTATAPTSLYEALERETQRILDDRVIEDSIELLVHCDHEIWTRATPLHRARPVITLTFEGEYDRRSCVVDQKLPATLAAVAVILNHSFRMRKYPELKASFWRELLMTNMLIREDPYEEPDVEDWLWMVQDESFPVFHVDMNRRGVMTAKHMAVFLKFLTTTPPHGVSSEYAEQYEALLDNKLVPIGLTSGLSKMTAKCLQRMTTLLDDVYASPTRLYAINCVDLNYHVTKAQELQCVREIFEKNNQSYKIPNLRLVNIARACGPSEKEDANLLRQVIVAALDAGCSSSPASESSAPRTLGVMNTSFALKHVMALCSALRYGCAMDKLKLRDIFYKVDKLEREQCWRWIAFGLFSPRSAKFAAANKLHRLDLSHTIIEREDAEAFIRTLENPARELVYGGGQPQPQQQCTSQAVSKLLVCLVKPRSQFYKTPQAKSKVSWTLDSEMQLEVLCQERGWTCVVLPGLGFAWVKNDQIIRTEEETIDADSLRFELKFTHLLPSDSSHDGFLSFITNVGRHLSFLDISNSLVNIDAQTLAEILKHCAHVEHLVLRSMMMHEAHIDALLMTLRGDLGQRLLSLDVSGNYFRESVFEKLAQFMESSQSVLQELRIVDCVGARGALTAIEKILQVNKKIRLLDFPRTWRNEGDRTADEVYDRIQDAHQGEPLLSPLPLELKLAFLSVMGPQVECRESVRSALDSFMVSAIFKFAASEAPRRIFWH